MAVVVELLAPHLRELGRQRLGLAVGDRALPRQLERLVRARPAGADRDRASARPACRRARRSDRRARRPALSAGEPGSTCATNISACSRPVYVWRLSVGVDLRLGDEVGEARRRAAAICGTPGHLGAAEVHDARAARELAELALDVAPVAHRLAVDADDQIAGAQAGARRRRLRRRSRRRAARTARA